MSASMVPDELIEQAARDFDDAKARIRSAHYNGEPLERMGGI